MTGISAQAFFVSEVEPSLLLVGSYDPWLVMLSIGLAVMSSTMALQLSDYAGRLTEPSHRHLALICGSLALGGGIWSMHFIGMLAFNLCTRVTYDALLTVLSVLPGVLASWVALVIVSQQQLSKMDLVLGGVLVGAGIGAMHYSGMAAMTMAPVLRYDPLLFSASIVVAVCLAMLALWVRFELSHRLGMTRHRAIVLGGVVMGGAISGMHYTAMTATRFIGAEDPKFDIDAQDHFYLAVAIAMVTVLVSLLVGVVVSLLRYRQLYREMQLSESRYRAIVDTAIDGIISINSVGIVEGYNRSAERIFGWKAHQVIGKNINMLMPEPQHSEHDGYLRNYLHTQHAKIIGYARDVMGLRADGNTIPIRLAVGKAGVPGKPVFVGFVADISQRVAMEKTLRKNEQQFRSLIANIPGVSFRCNVDSGWTMQFISDAIERLTGWQAEEFTEGKWAFSSIINPADTERVDREVRAALAKNQPYNIEYRLLCRDGSERWVSETGSGVRDENGEVLWIDGVIVDTTQQKIRNAEFEGVVNAINHALAVAEFDMKGNLINANSIFLALLGHSLEEVKGRHHDSLCFSKQPNPALFAQLVNELSTAHTASGEYRLQSQSGASIWVMASYNPVYDMDGKPSRIMLFANDLSQRRNMEIALRDAKEKAEAAAAAKSTFLANMSHEIRTPMNAIIGFSEVLLESDLTPSQQHQLTTIRNSARSLLGLLNDILDTAKLEGAAVELDETDFSLRALCEQVLYSLQLGAVQKGIELRYEYSIDVPPFFRGDALRIQQILLNLIGNAVKFTERGWVKLEVERHDETVLLRVSDTGIGIPDDRMQRIFDPFAQADASMTRRFGGTGLGLTICRQLAELMAGQVSVSSIPGQGSIFEVRLPLAEGNAPGLQKRSLHEKLPPMQVLIADDVAQNLELLELILGGDGHHVTSAHNGAQALQCAQETRFDVILMDLYMPVMTGLEAARQLRAFESDQQRARSPIIALTASVMQSDRVEAINAGMDGFVGKPVEKDLLMQEIARVTGHTTDITTALATHADRYSPVIDWEAGLQLWRDKAKLTKAIEGFLRVSNDQIPAIIAPTCSRNDIGLWAHKVRGAAGNLSLIRLFRASAVLEDKLKVNAEGDIDTALAAVLLAFDEVQAHLQMLPAAEKGTESVSAVAGADIVPLIDQLLDALQHSELDEDAISQLDAALSPTQTEVIFTALDNFEFDRARQDLIKLREKIQEDASQRELSP